MRCTFSVAALLTAIWAGSVQPVAAQVLNCLTPGEFKNDFSYDTQVLNNSLTRKARTILGITFPAEPLAQGSGFGRALVQFAGPAILLDAFANRPGGLPGDRQIEAFARGRLSVDFTVDCGTSANESATVAVSFRVRRVGRITTFSPGSTSSFGVSARIRDVAENRDIDFRVIEEASAGGVLGAIKTIAKVPVPIPDIENLSESKIETFVIQVRKGRLYRFELFAAARSTTGLHPSIVSVDFARANFIDPVTDLGLAGTPGIELSGFAMEVGTNPADVQAEVSELKKIVESLREAVAALSAQFEAVGTKMDARVSDLDEKIGELDERRGQTIDQLRLDLDTLAGAVRQAIDAITVEFQNHTHAYLTGDGEGHNNTSVTTSPPTKKTP